jgi:hypothetical protein
MWEIPIVKKEKNKGRKKRKEGTNKVKSAFKRLITAVCYVIYKWAQESSQWARAYISRQRRKKGGMLYIAPP